MVLRFTRGNFDPATYDDVLSIGQEVVMAMARLPGVQSVRAGVDRASGTLVAVTVVDKPEHAQFSREALGDLLPRLQALGVYLEPAEVFDVVLEASLSKQKPVSDLRVA
jgi:hypothetical protein